MPVHIDDVELHHRIARVDEPFDAVKTASYLAERVGEVSITGARQLYLVTKKRLDDEKDPLEKAWLMENKSTGIVIYGIGGWHRYYVQRDGNVVFSKRHGEAGVERAKKEGFDVLI